MLPFLDCDGYKITKHPLQMASRKANKHKNRVRIIAGKWRGSFVDFPDSEGLRPTSDRVKETVFNWLAPYIAESTVLDLFSGSGALGFEALSRGAKQVCFIEQEPLVGTYLKKNLEKLNAQNAQVIIKNALSFLNDDSLKDFDLIFLDPPYNLIEPLTLIKQLDAKLSQEKNCRLFYEHNSSIKEGDLPEHWEILKQKKAGQVYFHLLIHKPKASNTQ